MFFHCVCTELVFLELVLSGCLSCFHVSVVCPEGDRLENVCSEGGCPESSILKMCEKRAGILVS